MLDPDVCSVVVEGAKHEEDAWHHRLPFVLRFLMANQPCPTADTLR